MPPHWPRNKVGCGRLGASTDAGTFAYNLGSFIVSKLGGIYASNGVRYVNAVNFENSGLITTIRDCHASSDGATTTPGGTPMRYLIDFDGAASYGEKNRCAGLSALPD